VLDPTGQGTVLAVGDISVPADPGNADDMFNQDDSANPGITLSTSNSQTPGLTLSLGDATFQDDPFSSLGQRSQHPAISMAWVIRNGFLRFDEPDIEDPTVTGAPNEEIWRKPDIRP
jgi:hypothetical protein